MNRCDTKTIYKCISYNLSMTSDTNVLYMHVRCTFSLSEDFLQYTSIPRNIDHFSSKDFKRWLIQEKKKTTTNKQIIIIINFDT